MMNAIFKPNASDMAQLLALTKQPGFDTLNKLMLSEIDAMQLSIMNTDPADKDYTTLLAERHRLAKAAGMFYQKLMNRISNESQEFAGRQGGGEIQSDPTAALLEI